MSSQKINKIQEAVKSYPDFPKKGINFRDFLPILENPELFEDLLSVLQDHLKLNVPTLHGIAGLESRGFLIGTPLALKLKVPFIPIRKSGKLPGSIKRQEYELEYGTDALEIKTDALQHGKKVVIVDDLIATGGSMEAAVKLIQSIGGEVEHCLSVIELSELKGREKISAPVYSVFQY